jgi:UDP-glucose 4-epimerase
MANIEHLLGHPRFHFCRADVMNEVVLDRLASESQIIIHLAASVGVEKIVQSPAETIRNNVKGTEVVLEAALRYRARVLVASTSEVYGKGSKVPFAEEDDVVLGPTSKGRWSYAASKMVDEFLGIAYHREYGLDVVVARFFNTVGPRQTGQYGMVVPRFIGQALRNDPILVYGDGQQTRCFCDVRDVVRAVDALVIHPKAVGKVFNIGSQHEISILDLAQKIKAMTHSRSEIRFVPYDQAYAPGFEDMQRRVPDISRIRKLIGWKPSIPLERTLQAVRQQLLKEMSLTGTP